MSKGDKMTAPEPSGNTPPKSDRRTDDGVCWNAIELESYNMMAARALDELDLPTIERYVPVKELYALVEWAHKQDRRVVNKMRFPGGG